MIIKILVIAFLCLLSVQHYAQQKDFVQIQQISKIITKSLNVRSVQSQTHFSYMDRYGNIFYIHDINTLPKQFDTTFFKLHITGNIFSNYLLTDTLRYTVTIDDVKRINKNMFDLRLLKSPVTNDPLEVFKRLTYLHYEMKVKYRHGKTQLRNLQYIGFEI